MHPALENIPNHPGLIFLVGPTSVGKTALSLQLAERLGWEILSCDSLCFYRGMDIGTAKPTAEEQAQVRHHGVDLVPVHQRFDISSYLEYARPLVEKEVQSGRGLVVSGGSGFYLKSFFEPVVDSVETPPAVESEVQALFQREGLPGILRELEKLNPQGLGNLDVLNPRRVEKALMRCLASGKSLLQVRQDFDRLPKPYAGVPKHVILLQRDPESLRARIQQRTQQMLEAGLIDEVRQLKEQGIEQNSAAARAIGYRETLAWLKNPGDKASLAEKITTHTNQLVRKQRIWFRHQLEADRVVSLG
jgi:tRNA dimethylallyltransferase